MVDNGLNFLAASILKEMELLPKGSRPNLEKDKLIQFLENIDIKDRELFITSILCFFAYFKSIVPCAETPGTASIWTNYVLITLFALVERSMEKEVSFWSYINKDENIKRCNKGDTKKVIEEWRQKHGSSEKIRRFFKENIKKEETDEIEKVIKKDPKFKNVSDIDVFITKIIKLRGEFVHGLSLECISSSNIYAMLVQDKNGNLISDNMQWVKTIDINKLIAYILKGIFRKFDTKKIVTSI
ncbi:MAG: hypothetical protein M0R48_00745 [Candidatus Omnitrophica bacterium]|jgi:hypothetical protein|nr:hypothetical protein [Candidatus Omnitrophota bacterium]